MVIAVGLVSGRAQAQDAPAAPPPPATVSHTGGRAVSGTPAPPAPDPAVQGRIDALEQRTQLLEINLATAKAAATGTASRRRPSRPTRAGSPSPAPIASTRSGSRGSCRSTAAALRRRARCRTATTRSSFAGRGPSSPGTVLGLTDFILRARLREQHDRPLSTPTLDTHPFPWLRLRVGKFKGPVGLERLQSDTDLIFVERALHAEPLARSARWASSSGATSPAGSSATRPAYFNGNPDNGINDIDSNTSKTFEGRLFVQPFNAPSLQRLRAAGRSASPPAPATSRGRRPTPGWAPSSRSARTPSSAT